VRASLQALKARLREDVTARVAALSAAYRGNASAQARALLEQQSQWRRAESILFYAPVGSELDVWPLVADKIKAGKVVALPRFDPGTQRYLARQVKDLTRELARGHYGILEPPADCEMVSLNRLDFILVPGVAFDLHGRRLGRGKGFYDQLLAAVRGKTCAVAFEEQIVPEVPVEPHDSDVNCILTPTRWIEL
jgi:5-formyltetrahydrofolate cyclo-ligase